MQSAAGSLRGAGPSRSVRNGESSLIWGIGSDNLALSGHYVFRVIKGAVTICGITLSLSTSDNNKEDTVPSPWYTISSPVPPFPSFLPAHSRTGDDGFNIPAELRVFASVIEIQPATVPLNISSLAPPYKSLWHDVQRIENTNQPNVQIPNSWAEVLSSRTHTVPERHFLILGPKNSGKSSLARYLCNRLISNRSTSNRVFYMELDPGQPEFTPSGCLSLHMITDLSFSPSYAHADFRNTIKSHYLGYPSPMETPSRYLDMCSSLFDTFRSTASPNDFLVVNTPGWTKGLGLDLNTDIANMMDPIKALILHMGPSEFDLDLIELDKPDQNGLSDSGQAISTITTSGFSSAELRSLQIMCYLHQRDVNHLTTWAPYELSLGVESEGIFGFAVLDSTGINLPDDLRICVEGTLVSINIVDKDYTEMSPIVLSDFQANDIWEKSNCVGMGVVQSISDDLSSIRLLTPLDPTKFDLGNQKVVLVRGRIQLPIWELYNREFSQCPWVSTTKAQGTGATYTRFRRNIKRN